MKLQINGHTLQAEDSPTYLGITLDRRLTWKKHLQKTQAKAKQRLNLMKKLSGTQWGADQKVLKKLYVGRVRPILEYGMTSTSTAATTNTDKLARVQKQATRMNDDRSHENHTHQRTGDYHWASIPGRQKKHQDPDTSSHIQEDAWSPHAFKDEQANKGETKQIQLYTAEQHD